MLKADTFITRVSNGPLSFYLRCSVAHAVGWSLPRCLGLCSGRSFCLEGSAPTHPMKNVTSSRRSSLPTPSQRALSPAPCHLSILPTLLDSSWHMPTWLMFYGFIVGIAPFKCELWESCDSALFTAVFPRLGLRAFDQQWDPDRTCIILLFSLYLFFKNTFVQDKWYLFYIYHSDIVSFKNKFKNVSNLKRSSK